MNLSSPIDYTLLQNKFLNLMVVLWFWDFGRETNREAVVYAVSLQETYLLHARPRAEVTLPDMH